MPRASLRLISTRVVPAICTRSPGRHRTGVIVLKRMPPVSSCTRPDLPDNIAVTTPWTCTATSPAASLASRRRSVMRLHGMASGAVAFVATTGSSGVTRTSVSTIWPLGFLTGRAIPSTRTLVPCILGRSRAGRRLWMTTVTHSPSQSSTIMPSGMPSAGSPATGVVAVTKPSIDNRAP